MSQDQLAREIAKNIRNTVRRMKSCGTVGASVRCLNANTPTPTTVPDLNTTGYNDIFEAVAREVAADFLTS